ncbi:holo-[acyl-carrier protein] synthase [Diaminobutyricimonas aerilata]|uniref:Holo-[acyl-carrier-protein] synthase n=1 Tax=Diaminobutyricimonas aerilata TaxID=1162967 RepID=A0A2M9CMQ7_9MICO|nr:holo-ACP synthase [Diaminobutyricimonas aerilata]PJJ73183.1 holo-[acyl-carrier protein] synthase [Diaminobutyricimonas aerilata]
MIAGIGVDVVDLARFERALSRTPRLRDRLFGADEQVVDGRPRPLRSLAGRFAAKEALIKALGGSDGVTWHDIAVVSGPQGDPDFRITGRLAALVEERGIARIHLSMSHDAGIAVAYVVVES